MYTINELLKTSHGIAGISIGDPILKKALSEEQERIEKSQIESARMLLEQMSNMLSNNVRMLRSFRKSERDQKALVARISRAVAYFGQTRNPLPYYLAVGNVGAGIMFLCGLGHDNNSPICQIKHEAWQIPKDWKPETELPEVENSDDSDNSESAES